MEISLLPVLKIARVQIGQLYNVGTSQTEVLSLGTFIYELSYLLYGNKKRCHPFLCFMQVTCSFLRFFR